MSRIAELIREARATAGLTQAELAARAGTSQPTIAAYERGTKVPSAATLERLLATAGMGVGAIPLPQKGRSAPLDALVRRHRAAILEIAARHGAKDVRIFGSVARGQTHRASDIDLLVDMEPGRSLLDQVRLRRALNDLLPVDVDVVTVGGYASPTRTLLLSRCRCDEEEEFSIA